VPCGHDGVSTSGGRAERGEGEGPGFDVLDGDGGDLDVTPGRGRMISVVDDELVAVHRETSLRDRLVDVDPSRLFVVLDEASGWTPLAPDLEPAGEIGPEGELFPGRLPDFEFERRTGT